MRVNKLNQKIRKTLKFIERKNCRDFCKYLNFENFFFICLKCVSGVTILGDFKNLCYY